MNTRRRFARAFLATVVGAGLAACGGPEQPSDGKVIVIRPVVFGKGFYNDESFTEPNGKVHHFRWVGLSATAELPPVAGTGRLTFTLGLPIETLSRKPKITINLNGKKLETFVGSKTSYAETFLISSTQLRGEQPSTLVISTTETVVPAVVTKGKSSDNRELGMQIADLSFEPVP